jgi:hypothetical protein
VKRIREGGAMTPYQENASIFTRDILMGTIKPCLSIKRLVLDTGNMMKWET